MNSSKILNELLCATVAMICWYQYGVQVPGLASELRENISRYGRSEELSAETHWCKYVMQARLIICKDLACQEKISLNLHLCLHICECVLDYGPLSSFWCF